ncbi:MAG TPA: DUF1361 domain-containing protein [Candidatus Saccharimonadales bacterium]|nr:DUF1361 domain-containing protein [Candidatus Saccharimonadales bacterium]
MTAFTKTETRFSLSLLWLSGLCLGLFLLRLLIDRQWIYLFIPGNLALAWASLASAWLLGDYLKSHRWQSWGGAGLSLLWLVLLPNSWYVLTDFIHLTPGTMVSQLYDIAQLGSLIITGYLLGFTSLYLVHRELRQRLSAQQALVIIEAVILISSLAIYMGRVLRWNSLDVILNPAGVIISLTDRIVDPLGHTSTLAVTGLFFVVLSIMYRAYFLLVQPDSKR